MMLEKLEHVAVMVSDIERSIDFYTRVLGLRLRERRKFKSLELAFVSIGDTELELIAGEETPKGDTQINHIAFSVPDLDAAMAAVHKADSEVEFTDRMELWEGNACIFFRGPDDERLEFMQRAAKAFRQK
jgi:lactoylglutathione lyase